MANNTGPRGGIPRIDIPAAVAIQRYGVHVATIMDQLAVSRQGRKGNMAARGREAKDFAWSIDYEQAADPIPNPEVPSTEDDFVNYLAKHSKVYLMARGYHWRGYVQIPPPPQVLAKFQERARLIFGMRNNSEEVDDGIDEDSGMRISDAELRGAVTKWQHAHPKADGRLLVVLAACLEQLIASAR